MNMWGDNVSLVYKGTLCDDHMHMTAHEYVEHKAREEHEKQKKLLLKMANNPILAVEYQDALRHAAWMYDLCDHWKKRCIQLMNKDN